MKKIKKFINIILNYFKIPLSYKIKQEILHILENPVKNDDIVPWISKIEIYKVILPEFNKNKNYDFYNTGEQIKEYSGTYGYSTIDKRKDLYNEKDILNVREFDIENCLDELEKEKLIEQNKKYENIEAKKVSYITLKGREFLKEGGFNYCYFIKNWIEKNIIIITLIIAIIAIWL